MGLGRVIFSIAAGAACAASAAYNGHNIYVILGAYAFGGGLLLLGGLAGGDDE